MACTTFALGNVLQAELDPAHRGGQRGNDSRRVPFRDPDNGRQVVEAAVAPDLIVGYAPGYRASWQTGLGATPAPELEDNTDAWIADHCINPVDVPGVLFTTQKQSPEHPRLQDVTGMVVGAFR